ncbi:hypothetical protein MMC06_003328 [Schaereria dolodes]|nr:hypothetical protein [Schaereria dolodes]
MAEAAHPHIESEDNDLHIQRYHDRPLSRPRISSRNRKARDITSDFILAASKLGTGQLVKDDFFTLFEAVGALEIMDPKMDSGYLASGEMLEDDYDILKDLLPEEVIGIMDQMLCFEMAWHMGNPLSQTIFTSLYVDQLLWPEPRSLEEARFDRDREGYRDTLLDVVLRPYCLGLIKTCDLVHRRISTETYYEEEDFVTNLYNRKLLTDFPVLDIERLLDKAIKWVGYQTESISEELRIALDTRLCLRKRFLHAVALDIEVVNERDTAYWKQCFELLPYLYQSRSLGVPIESSFSAKVQRRLASTVPPRPIVDISFDDAHAHLKRLCLDGTEVVRILDYHGGSNIMTFVWTFLSRKPQSSVYIRCLLQALIFNEMRILGSLSIQQFIFDDLEEIVLPADILVDPANTSVEAPNDLRFQIAKKMDVFVGRCGESYLDIIRAISMNRSRARRMLCHIIVDWDNLQLDAEEIDVELRSYTKEVPVKDKKIGGEEVWSFPLSSWAYYQKLRQMEWIVQMGFELDVYQVDELAGMYWYLQHLAQTRLQHLERIRTFTNRRFTRLFKPNSQQEASFTRSFSFLNYAMLEASAIQSFADALSCLYTCLSQLSLLPTHHPLPYSSPSLRHSLRMRPFLQISLPTVPSYPDFAALVSPFFSSSSSSQTTDSIKKTSHIDRVVKPHNDDDDDTRTVNSLLASADQAIKAARKEWEALGKASAETARCVGCEDGWRTAMKDVLRSVIAAGIAVGGVRKWVAEGGMMGGKEKEEGLRVEVGGKAYSDYWIVPKVVLRVSGAVGVTSGK